MSLADDIFATADDVLDDVFGSTGTYSRGDDECEVTCCRMTHDFIVADEQGVQTSIRGGEWYVQEDGFEFSEEPVIPQHGDELEVDGETFVVVPIGGKPAADHLPARNRWLIRTKKVV